ncbi:hypothetical protein BDP67DRAFT_99655 [Colletotrichum lupini]|nr:hypothetical protein BDP67DRAFT_99655 [Colletotrichum lupini]
MNAVSSLDQNTSYFLPRCTLAAILSVGIAGVGATRCLKCIAHCIRTTLPKPPSRSRPYLQRVTSRTRPEALTNTLTHSDVKRFNAFGTIKVRRIGYYFHQYTIEVRTERCCVCNRCIYRLGIKENQRLTPHYALFFMNAKAMALCLGPIDAAALPNAMLSKRITLPHVPITQIIMFPYDFHRAMRTAALSLFYGYHSAANTHEPPGSADWRNTNDEHG